MQWRRPSSRNDDLDGLESEQALAVTRFSAETLIESARP